VGHIVDGDRGARWLGSIGGHDLAGVLKKVEKETLDSLLERSNNATYWNVPM
jgi:hypothetical protein